jgi:branched-chain amino acid transport system ATP-binding protein
MLLELKDVSVNYGKVRALKNVSIAVEQGEMVSVVGANGAGKTTALRAVAGLHKLAGGEIWFDGQRIDGKSTEEIIRRGVGFCMEGRRLFPFMTVLENLQMGAYCRRGAEVKSGLEEVFTMFPVLKERQRQAAGTLSGGQQQMLTLGRSLMGKPKLLMLDEPSLGLAPMVVSDLAKTIKGFQVDRGLTVLLVEQNARMALRISNRAYALEVGSIAVEGDSASLATNDYVKKAYLGV